MQVDNIKDYILQQTRVRPIIKGDKILINSCPICGHRDHFFVYPATNSYFSFSGCCRGGSMVDWLMEYEKLSLPEAMRQVHGETNPVDTAKQKEQGELARLLAEKVENFYSGLVQKYQIFRELEAKCRKIGLEKEHPGYRYIRQGLEFFDHITEKFINSNFEQRVRLMRSFKDSYFFKLSIRVGERVEH